VNHDRIVFMPQFCGQIASLAIIFREMSMFVRRCQIAFCLLGGLLATDGARAGDVGSPGELINGLMQGLGLSPSVPPAADFVVRSRPAPDQLDYEPFRPPPPGFLESANLPVKRFEAEQESIRALEDARARNLASAGRVGTPEGATPAEKSKYSRPK
jgi:hypothetical protein